MECYNAKDVLDMEAEVIALLPPDTELGSKYWKEPVAQYLYAAWEVDNEDTRILSYCFPLIYGIISTKVRIINGGITVGDIFNDLSIKVLHLLPKYDISRGKLFSFLTFKVKMGLIDILTIHVKASKRESELLEAVFKDTFDDILELLAFKLFLLNIKKEAGFTTNRIIDALLVSLEEDGYQAGANKDLIKHLSTATGLPEIIISTTLTRIVTKYGEDWSSLDVSVSD